MTMWMVRAGRGGRFADEYLSRKLAGLGWEGIADTNSFASKADLIGAVKTAYPNFSEGTVLSCANQLWRFRNELSVGDDIVTYDAGSRTYYLGKISSAARYEPSDIEELTYCRSVDWLESGLSREDLSDNARNRLGSVLTLFKVTEETAHELLAVSSGLAPNKQKPLIEDDIVSDPFANITDEAALRIADRISGLDWNTMQRLVAALLRAMGYKTVISPDGPDRGKDILASPDGFGFENPRIVVEVKHRKGQMGAPEIRSFLGGRHKDDRGLYVSTGGFSKEAKYEAERSNIPIKLMNLDDLARAIVEYYETFDGEGKAILPLTRLYWPA